MEVVVKRSKKRRKTVQARMVEGKMEVLAPAYLSESALKDHIANLQARLAKRDAPRDDAHLDARARYLNRKYFHGDLSWESIRYSSRQERRRGSCNHTARTLLISQRLIGLPQWVEDYVIVHELAHLIEPNHGKRFKALMGRYPLAERAIGFLMATEMLQQNRG
jgi:predicted metal-dependent hydrolase